MLLTQLDIFAKANSICPTDSIYSLRELDIFSLCENERYLSSKKSDQTDTYNKAGFTSRKRSTDDLFVLLFTRLALQGIVCYTFSIYYRVVI